MHHTLSTFEHLRRLEYANIHKYEIYDRFFRSFNIFDKYLYDRRKKTLT
jgi:hypothetical protein